MQHTLHIPSEFARIFVKEILPDNLYRCYCLIKYQYTKITHGRARTHRQTHTTIHESVHTNTNKLTQHTMTIPLFILIH